jgi:hypothetical protein
MRTPNIAQQGDEYTHSLTEFAAPTTAVRSLLLAPYELDLSMTVTTPEGIYKLQWRQFYHIIKEYKHTEY